MSKKEESFKLFDQGKKPSDPEVRALGLKKGTPQKYFNIWSKPAVTVAPEVPAAPVLVQVGSLKTAAFFELKGERYRVGEKTPELVVCNRLRFFDTGPLPIDKMWRVDLTISIATFTMVKPIK